MNANLLCLALILGAPPVDDDTFLQQMIQRKLPPPATLEELSEQARRMKQLGADNAQIAEYVSIIVDKRLLASNKPWGESLFLTEEAKADRDARWKPIDNFTKANDGLPGKPLDDGKKYEKLAGLAWDNKVGNCAESAAVSYTILKNAGIPVKIFTSSAGGGHEFAVIGLAPNADPNDPSTWGKDARVVDGWIGHSLTPSDARDNRWVFNGKTGGKMVVTDQTNGYDNPKAAEFLAELGNRGIVEVTVKDAKGNAVAGALVTLRAQEAQQLTTSPQGIARFKGYPGQVTIGAVGPGDSDLGQGEGAVYVETGRVMSLTIVLKEVAESTVTITAPQSGLQTAASDVTVTGTFKKLENNSLLVELNGSRHVASVDDASKQFHITLPIDMGENTIRAHCGSAASGVVVVTRVDKPKSPWDGTWRGNYKTTIESTDGSPHVSELVMVVRISEVDKALRMEARREKAQHEFVMKLASPLIAIDQRSEKFNTTDTFYGGQELKTICTLREGRVYMTSELICTVYSRANSQKPWKKSITIAKGSGTLTRDP